MMSRGFCLPAKLQSLTPSGGRVTSKGSIALKNPRRSSGGPSSSYSFSSSAFLEKEDEEDSKNGSASRKQMQALKKLFQSDEAQMEPESDSA